MRTCDGLTAIIAATFGFGAIVVAAEGAHWAVVASFATLAALLCLAVLVKAVVTPRVVLVGDPDGPNGGRLQAITQALDDAGFGVRSCDGPTHHPCPVLRGNPCPVHGHASAVVVFHPKSYSGPVPPCGEALGLPQLTIEDRSHREPEVNPRKAHIGGAKGPDAAIAALTTLIGKSPARS